MEEIPVANINRSFSARLKKTIAKAFSEIKPVFFYTKKSFCEYMSYETPELVIINFSDKPKIKYEILNEIYKDKWLNSAGIIAIHDYDKEEDFINKVKHTNIIAAVNIRYLEENLVRILKILRQHRNILFQRAFQAMFIGKTSGSFLISNDLLYIQVYANLLVNFIYNCNYIDEEGKMSLKLILNELLINACEHGNCNISFEEKSKIMNEGRSLADIIAEKVQNDPAIAKKKIKLDYNINNKRSWIRITDQGTGFDWRKQLQENAQKSPEELLLHGRGIHMSQGLCKNFKYNDKGNSVRFEFMHTNTNYIVPGFFEKDSETRFKKGETVFTRGETSNYLYYIASGEYDVLDQNNNILSTLSSNDIFLGEMSFLLYNVRTATVKVRKDGTLYRLTKKNFIS
ncbi:MAG TPA: cyclic nucleotide-binding domain-containing protein, partial [Spirochaetota bacterium]|nr:cyclic nucleotide-binding domain-containing protein [Spirochaetota bacterium]